MAHKFIIISNRLPVSVKKVDGKLEFSPSSGGLATAMSSLGGDNKERLWIGWPGIPADELNPAEKATITRKLRQEGCYPVFLTQAEIDNFYGGYSNATLWPLFHYFQGTAVFSRTFWQAYKNVNKKFQKVVTKQTANDATVWVHDYQLMLLPKMLREALPKTSIGFFLHIPFPSFEIFRLLPDRKAILEGLLGADLVGFHTYDYARHFTSSVRRTLGFDSHSGSIALDGRVVRAEAFPIGIDYEKFARTVKSQAVQEEVHVLHNHYRGQKIILSVDRLDYSKGIAERLAAYERFLEDYPQYQKQVVLAMIAVPSRTDVEAYQYLRDQIEQTVSRINGRFGTVDWTPISYQFQSLPFDQLLALYATADVALVTPLRDGMNLVAKEYIAAKQRTSGALILSELTGAVDELPEALRINPNNTDAVARAIKHALTMPKTEQRRRLNAMQKRISSYNVQRWAEDFTQELAEAAAPAAVGDGKTITSESRQEIIAAFKKARKRAVLLDYDGTIKGLISSPDPKQAAPSKRLKNLLETLGSQEGTVLAIVSGRQRPAMEKWFKKLPVELAAEHGFWLKRGGEWAVQDVAFKHIKQQARPILERYTERTPGAEIEEKDFSLVWHYRNVSPELAFVRKTSLRHELNSLLADSDIGVYGGHKILEVKPRSVNKGHAALELLAGTKPDITICIGDDQTDEDMFEMLGEEAYTIKVGSGDTRAHYRVGSVNEVLKLLKQLADSV